MKTDQVPIRLKDNVKKFKAQSYFCRQSFPLLEQEAKEMERMQEAGTICEVKEPMDWLVLKWFQW